jgi:hypothetical protein
MNECKELTGASVQPQAQLVTNYIGKSSDLREYKSPIKLFRKRFTKV